MGEIKMSSDITEENRQEQEARPQGGRGSGALRWLRGVLRPFGLLRENLKKSGFDRAWLDVELRHRGLRQRDVFLMRVDAHGSVLLIQKEEK
jgi:hypothetical protein